MTWLRSDDKPTTPNVPRAVFPPLTYSTSTMTRIASARPPSFPRATPTQLRMCQPSSPVSARTYAATSGTTWRSTNDSGSRPLTRASTRTTSPPSPTSATSPPKTRGLTLFRQRTSATRIARPPSSRASRRDCVRAPRQTITISSTPSSATPTDRPPPASR